MKGKPITKYLNKLKELGLMLQTGLSALSLQEPKERREQLMHQYESYKQFKGANMKDWIDSKCEVQGIKVSSV